MCALLGIVLPRATKEDIALANRLLLESRIRGKHATGVTYLKGGYLNTIRGSVPAEDFLQAYSFANFVDSDGSLRAIAHCRYSTSDLLYNQPVFNADVALVHNGVVSQELPKNWPYLYGYVCSTKNDSELLLRTIRRGRSPLLEWQQASLAVIELYRNGNVRAYRNGKRPLYLTKYGGGYIFTSTVDIARRAGLPIKTFLLAHNHYTMIDNYKLECVEPAHVEAEDLQYDI